MNPTTRPLLSKLVGPHAEGLTASYDVVSQMMFPTMEHLTDMLNDPYYKEHVQPDDANFADMSKTKCGLFPFPFSAHTSYLALLFPIPSVIQPRSIESICFCLPFHD